MAWPVPSARRPRLGRPPERSKLSLPTFTLLAYGGLAAVSFGASAALGRNPLEREAWLPTSGLEAALASMVLGLAVAALTLLGTRHAARARWARAIGEELHPLVRGRSEHGLVLMALSSGVGEELFFRGLLSPWVGVVLSSLAFGVVHQIRGPGRVGWMVSAALLGLAFALVFGATGSLVGPIVGHVLVNYVNLRGLRQGPVEARPLGGLLGRRR